MRATLALADATLRDLTRRPGILLAVLALAVFLQVLPDLCARAVDDSAALALQAALTTITLFLQLFAAFAGLRAASREGDLAASAEWRSSPLTSSRYILGRFAGIVVAASLLLLFLLPLALIRQFHGLAQEPFDPAAWASMAAGALLTAALFASLGLLLASIASPQFAAVSVIGAFIATRLLVPELAAREGFASTIAHLLPDPSRLDLARELAFHRAPGIPAVLWGTGGAALQTATLLLAAAWALQRREN